MSKFFELDDLVKNLKSDSDLINLDNAALIIGNEADLFEFSVPSIAGRFLDRKYFFTVKFAFCMETIMQVLEEVDRSYFIIIDERFNINLEDKEIDAIGIAKLLKSHPFFSDSPIILICYEPLYGDCDRLLYNNSCVDHCYIKSRWY